MKVIQTDNQIELKSNGVGQLVAGIIFFIVGAGLTVVLLSTPGDNGKKAPIWAALFGLVFAVIGIFVSFMAQNRRTIIQRGGEVTISAKRLLGGSAQQQSVPVANVIAVRLSTSADYTSGPEGDTSNQRRSVLSLALNNNDLIEIGSDRSSGFSVNGINLSSLITKAPLSKEAQQIASFLNVPIQADDTSSIAGAVQSVKSAFQQNSGSPTQPPTQTVPLNPAAAPSATSSTPSPPLAQSPPSSPATTPPNTSTPTPPAPQPPQNFTPPQQ